MISIFSNTFESDTLVDDDNDDVSVKNELDETN